MDDWGAREPAAPRRRLVAVGALSWVVFALAWWRVWHLHAQVGANVLEAVSGCAALVLAIDLWWVAHNRRIYRRKGPRRGLPAPVADRSRDSLGRPVVWASGALQSQVVVLSLDETGTKTVTPAVLS